MAANQKHQKLELTWIGKGEEPKLEPRILIENPEYSYGDPKAESMLIQGDNLLALKALEQKFTGKVKCIYIDPPYNTGSAFEHYDDGIEHSLWLSLMTPRLKILQKLLTIDGSIWVSIDDNECHYLKVLMDDIFGRRNFVCNVIWQKKYAPQSNTIWISESHDHILVYARDKSQWKAELLPRSEEMNKAYKNPDNDKRGLYKADNFTISLTGGQRGAQYAKTGYSANIYEIITPSGRKVWPPKGRCWAASPARYQELLKDDRIYFGAKGDNVPSIKRFLSEVQDGIVPQSLWLREDAGDNQDAKREVTLFNSQNVFATPKPEKLRSRIISIASKPNELVLDSFLGSGTTAAVANKMGRKYIGIELGEHAITHCYPRLKQVVDGEQGGISEMVNWQGGGGFKFYKLAPSLLNQDKHGNWIIAKEYDAQMLAAAMAKQEGFHYAPSDRSYWKQGISSEQDFIFTTTQFLTIETLDVLHEEMKEGESLLICCKAFQKECKGKYPNITIKKIPQMLLGRCEFGKEDYSLNIVNMPSEAKLEDDTLSVQEISAAKEKKPTKNQQSLF